MNNTRIPVLLLTGYLGSGKTTLLNKILSNKKGIKFAVIVNDLGEVNIDASLIAKGGIVSKGNDSLVALQNGCICCTLKMDLVNQIDDLVKMKRFDYIVIEASGICEPAPIAQTICSIPALGPQYTKDGIAYLDCIVSVVDALRLQTEFDGGKDLQRDNIDEEDIANLIIQQIEFCNIILLNKASEVSAFERGRIKAIIRAIQPTAEIIECDYCDVDLDKIVNTRIFDFNRAATSAAWIREMETPVDDDEDEHHEDEHHEHEHHGHNHHHHHEDEGEAEEYGISTFVYYRRQPFDIVKFDTFVTNNWPANVIRSKGLCWFASDNDMSYLFEQSGVSKQLSECGQWYATAPKYELEQMMAQDPSLRRDWDDEVGDRMIKLVFIGQNMDKEQITNDLDRCLY